MNTTWETHKFEHYIFSLLLAVEVIMSFTFLGYVHIPPISITTAYIPIIITACLFGPTEASLAGLLFGLGSLYRLPRPMSCLQMRSFLRFGVIFPLEAYC